MVATLEENIAAYEEVVDDLELEHLDKWVTFYDCDLVGTYQSSEDAAKDAIFRFGRGPYLIKRVGVRSWRMPATWELRGIRV